MGTLEDKTATIEAGLTGLASWFKLAKIGDSIVGTVINAFLKPNDLGKGYNDPQTVYQFKTVGGEVYNLGSKPAIDEQMQTLTNPKTTKKEPVKLGQIVGMKFVTLGKEPSDGRNRAHIITVMSDFDMDDDWVAQNPDLAGKEAHKYAIDNYTPEGVSTLTATPNTPTVPDVGGDEPAEAPKEMSTTDKITRISELAKEKLKATTPEDTKTKVAKHCGLHPLTRYHPMSERAVGQRPRLLAVLGFHGLAVRWCELADLTHQPRNLTFEFRVLALPEVFLHRDTAVGYLVVLRDLRLGAGYPLE